MTLKLTTKTVHSVNYYDLDVFVNEYFGFENRGNYQGFPYEFAAIQECGNDSSHEFSVDGYVDEWSQGELDQWIESKGEKGYVSNHTILDYLAGKRVIPTGDYVVSVSW